MGQVEVPGHIRPDDISSVRPSWIWICEDREPLGPQNNTHIAVTLDEES